MNKALETLGERMVVLMRVINIDGFHSNNNAKFRHELSGMIMAVQAMDIDIDFDYDREVTHYTAVILMGKRYEV